jgi:hypothetical protein
LLKALLLASSVAQRGWEGVEGERDMLGLRKAEIGAWYVKLLNSEEII